MNPEEIKLWDWQRMLVGEVTPAFLLEIVFRILIVYLILMVAMRFLGKRMAAQFSRNEMAAMVSLAAAIGVPILAPDRGILPPIIIAIVVVSISRTIAFVSAKNQKVESVTQGSIDALVKDAVMDPHAMVKTRISRERILAELRSEGIHHLGQVRRLYMEANGMFTMIRANDPTPGLSVIPDEDREFLHELKSDSLMVCHTCGNRSEGNSKNLKCSNCQHTEWVRAVVS